MSLKDIADLIFGICQVIETADCHALKNPEHFIMPGFSFPSISELEGLNDVPVGIRNRHIYNVKGISQHQSTVFLFL
jgi:hypothetical protein